MLPFRIRSAFCRRMQPGKNKSFTPEITDTRKFIHIHEQSAALTYKFDKYSSISEFKRTGICTLHFALSARALGLFHFYNIWRTSSSPFPPGSLLLTMIISNLQQGPSFLQFCQFILYPLRGCYHQRHDHGYTKEGK